MPDEINSDEELYKLECAEGVSRSTTRRLGDFIKDFKTQSEIESLEGEDKDLPMYSMPEWQRKTGVWTPKQKSLLIESLILGLYIPAVCVASIKGEKNNIFHVVDGGQRLSTIKSFLNCEFPLTHVEALGSLKGLYFRDCKNGKGLPQNKRNDLINIDIHIFIQQNADINRVLLLFERLNRGSLKLNDMEVWRAVYSQSLYMQSINKIAEQKDVQDFLQKYVAMDSSQTSHERAGIQYWVLRYFYTLAVLSKEKGFVTFGGKNSIKKFLDIRCHGTNDKKHITAQPLSPASIEQDQINLLKSVIGCINDICREPDIKLKFPTSIIFTAVLSNYLENIKNPRKIIDRNLDLLRKNLRTWIENPEFSRCFDNSNLNSDRQFAMKKYCETILAESGIYEENRDKQRLFTKDQKKLIWEKSKKIDDLNNSRKCGKCGNIVFENEWDADHILSWDEGGKTDVSNGQVTHVSCNRSNKKQ